MSPYVSGVPETRIHPGPAGCQGPGYRTRAYRGPSYTRDLGLPATRVTQIQVCTVLKPRGPKNTKTHKTQIKTNPKPSPNRPQTVPQTSIDGFPGEEAGWTPKTHENSQIEKSLRKTSQRVRVAARGPPEKHTNITEYFPETGFDVLPAAPGRRATSHD